MDLLKDNVFKHIYYNHFTFKCIWWPLMCWCTIYYTLPFTSICVDHQSLSFATQSQVEVLHIYIESKFNSNCIAKFHDSHLSALLFHFFIQQLHYVCEILLWNDQHHSIKLLNIIHTKIWKTFVISWKIWIKGIFCCQ
jgi:hypothetical protein